MAPEWPSVSNVPDAKESPLTSEPVRHEVMSSVGRQAFREFNTAFALMSLIPLLIMAYLFTAKLFTLPIMKGVVGLYFAIAAILALLGFVVGQQILRLVIKRLVNVSMQLRQHELMKSAFVANVAYELRPPLAAVQTSLQNMSDGLIGSLTESQVGTVGTCNEVLGRLVRLVTDLIAVTDIQEQRSQLQRDTLELQALLHEAVRINTSSLEANRLRVVSEFPQQPALFFGDRARLLQAMSSLIDHAVRWSPPGGAITVNLRPVLEGWQVVVAHQIAANQVELDRAFQSLRRLGAEAESYLGLGFRLVKEVIELHYGRFWVEGTPGRDSQLNVTLPSEPGDRIRQ